MDRIEEECLRVVRSLRYDIDRETMIFLVGKVRSRFAGKAHQPSPKDIHRVFLEEYHARLDTSCATKRVAQLFLRPEELDQEAEWEPLEDVLENLEPPLLEIHFIDRCLAALRILEWPYKQIGDEFTKSLPGVSGQEVMKMGSEAFHDLFRLFRSRVCDSLHLRPDKHFGWLRELLVHEDNWRLTDAAVEVLGQILERPAGFPAFGRPGDPYAMLRDRWKEIKEGKSRLTAVAKNMFLRDKRESR